MPWLVLFQQFSKTYLTNGGRYADLPNQPTDLLLGGTLTYHEVILDNNPKNSISLVNDVSLVYIHFLTLSLRESCAS